MSDPISELVSSIDDPRVSREDFRLLPGTGDDGDVTVIGVVHEHPASVYRVERATALLDPDVVALELPPLATPLFERYADEPDAGSAGAVPSGGEMSAAIRASGDARVVGIDLPDVKRTGTVLDALRAEQLSVPAAVRALRSFESLFGHALRCRIANWASRIGVTIDPHVDRGTETTGCSPSASADEQAAAEAAVIGAGTTLLRSFTRPPAVRTFDRARERAMARTLTELGRDGSVVAVVGYAHMDPIADAMNAASTRE